MRTVKRLVVSMGTHRRSFPSPSANRGGGTPIHVFRRLFKCPRSSIRYIKRSSIVPESADGNVSTAGPSLSLSLSLSIFLFPDPLDKGGGKGGSARKLPTRSRRNLSGWGKTFSITRASFH